MRIEAGDVEQSPIKVSTSLRIDSSNSKLFPTTVLVKQLNVFVLPRSSKESRRAGLAALNSGAKQLEMFE